CGWQTSVVSLDSRPRSRQTEVRLSVRNRAQRYRPVGGIFHLRRFWFVKQERKSIAVQFCAYANRARGSTMPKRIVEQFDRRPLNQGWINIEHGVFGNRFPC